MRLLTVSLAGLATVLSHCRLSSAALVDKRIECFINSPTFRTPTRPSRPASSIYLTNLTAPFAVEGAALPYANFDIGESYAGFLPIDNDGDDDYFFWFVPSINPAAKDEVVIWLNGGPGASSLDGFLHANGPFTWQPGTHAPVPNTWAWSNLTNVIWVDQPLGTGYSNGNPNVRSEDDIARFFLAFWKHFVDVFEFHHAKVYLVGESYAGKYVPYIANAMIDEKNEQYFDVAGAMLFNPGIGDDMLQSEVPIPVFAAANSQSLALNESYTSHLRNASATCGYDDYLDSYLQFPPPGPLPSAPGLDSKGRLIAECEVFTGVFQASLSLNPCFNMYQINQPCPIPFDAIGFPYSGHYLPNTFPQPYFNLSTVKHALHVPLTHHWTVSSITSVFINGADLSPPSADHNGPLQRVIEHTSNVIIANGDLDMAVPTNGTLLALQNLTWNGAQGFSNPPAQPLWIPKAQGWVQESMAGAGLLGKWMKERGLTFAQVFGAGHQVPEWQPSVAYRQLELLLGRIENMSETRQFTTQTWFEGWDVS